MADARADAVTDVAGKLTERVAAFVKKERLPGAAAGVVVDDELVWSTGYGYADVEARRPHDARTLFRIASITKTFTATAILQLRDEGKLHLDDPAVAFLPELRDATSPFGMIETVTIRRMLSHESGLMGDPPGARWFHDIYEASPAANLAKGAEIATKIPPNVQQKYSNLAFQLLGEIVVPARRHGRTRTRSAGRILDPLGMTSSGFHPLPPELLERRAVGYKPRWLSDAFVPFSLTLTEFPLAEGGLQSSVEDVATVAVGAVPDGEGGRRAPDGPVRRDAARDAAPALPRGRQVGGGLGDRLVRRAQGRDRVAPALGRPARFHHERVLPREGARRARSRS